MIKRVAVVKFRIDNGCGDGTSCFFVIEVRTDARIREQQDLESAEIWSGKEMFIKDKAKVTS